MEQRLKIKVVNSECNMTYVFKILAADGFPVDEMAFSSHPGPSATSPLDQSHTTFYNCATVTMVHPVLYYFQDMAKHWSKL